MHDVHSDLIVDRFNQFSMNNFSQSRLTWERKVRRLNPSLPLNQKFLDMGNDRAKSKGKGKKEERWLRKLRK